MDQQQRKTIGLTLLLTLMMLWLNYFLPSRTPQQETESEEVPVAPLAKMRQCLEESVSLPNADLSLSNQVVSFRFKATGGMIEQVKLKAHQKYTGQPVELCNEKNSYMDWILRCDDGEVLHTKDFLFDIEEKAPESITFVYRHDDREDLAIRITYTLSSQAYTLQRKVTLGAGWNIKDNTIDFVWFNSLKNQEKHIGNSQRNTQICYLKQGNRSYFKGHKEQEKQELALEEVDWVSFQQPFFLQSLIVPQPMQATIFMAPDFHEDTLAHTALVVKHTTEELTKGSETSFYFGPNSPTDLRGVGHQFEKNHYYGPWILGSANKYVITPLADTLGTYTDNFLLVLFLIVIFLALLQFFFIYKTQVNSLKMKTIKPFLEAIKAKGLSESAQKMEEMNFYRKVNINPLVSLVPLLLNFPIMFSMMNFVRYTICFRGISFLWIEDLASYDDLLTFPFSIPLIGNHLSLIALIATIFIGFVNYMRKESTVDDSFSNPYMMTFGLPAMMLFALNSQPAVFWLYRIFRNSIEALQQLICKKLINEDEIVADIQKKANVVDTGDKIPRAQKRLENKLKKKQ